MDTMNQLLPDFVDWSPDAPTVVRRTSRSVTLSWSAGRFAHLKEQLLYIVQRKEKIPPWATVYSGGKTARTVENLAPTHPHKFRLQVVCKPREQVDNSTQLNMTHSADDCAGAQPRRRAESSRSGVLRSRWSAETWCSTDGEGTTAACFCLAVRCGYLKQVQQMLEERPKLLSAINASSGLSGLATAASKGDMNMVRLLLSSGADVEQRSSCERTPLQLAVLAGHASVAGLLLEQQADIRQARDVNGLRVEHHAVDSGDLETLKLVLDRGDLEVTDNNGWTPLFRAVCQGSRTPMVEELVRRGGRVEITDRAGLTLLAAARLLKDKNGRARESVLKLVDAQFQREKVVAQFARLTAKVSTVKALLTRK